MTLRAKLVLSISVWLTILLGLLAVAHAAVRLWTLEGATATLAARDLISALVAASIVLCVLMVGVAALAARRLFAPMERAFADAQHAVREEARSRRENDAVARFAEQCTRFHHAPDLYRSLTRRMAGVVGANVCFVMLYERATNEMAAQGAGYGVPDHVIKTVRYAVTPAIKSGWDFSAQGGLLSNDPPSDRRVVQEVVRRLGLFNCVVVPFFFQGRVTGLVVAANKTKWFTHEDVRLLTAFSSHLSLTVANQQLHQEMRRMTRDSLTGLYNGRYLRAQLDRTVQATRETGSPVSLITIAVNDLQSCLAMYGRLAADRSLKELSALLVALVNRGVVARQEPDEFAALLPETDHEEAAAVAERIRAAIDDHRFAVEMGIPVELTVRVGVACVTAPASVDALVQASREAARRAGRPAAVSSLGAGSGPSGFPTF